jgi:hypothetical protein
MKAGNHLGTSTLTDPVRFTTGDKYITSAASLGKTTLKFSPSMFL